MVIEYRFYRLIDSLTISCIIASFLADDCVKSPRPGSRFADPVNG